MYLPLSGLAVQSRHRLWFMRLLKIVIYYAQGMLEQARQLHGQGLVGISRVGVCELGSALYVRNTETSFTIVRFIGIHYVPSLVC